MIIPSKIAPLKYIKFFLQQDSFISYEKIFFDNPVNPSFKSNRKEGYIYYLKNTFVVGESRDVTLYFKDELEKTLTLHTNKALVILNERKDEIENTEKNANIYINQQLTKLDSIKQDFNFDETYQVVVFRVLDKLKGNLQSLLIKEESTSNRLISKINYNAYFKLKIDFKIKHLKNLYSETVNIGIIDDDHVCEEDFINVFTAVKLPIENHRIVFNKDNRSVVFYINTISILFDNLSSRAIHKSMAFYNKNGGLLKEGEINKVKTFLRQNDVSKYDYIKTVLPK